MMLSREGLGVGLLGAVLFLPSQAAEKLETLVVEEEPIAEQPLGTVVPVELLLGTPGAAGDPMRALQALPGIAVVDDSVAEPAIRGSRPGDNIYEVDFIPVGHIFHLGGGISVFNAQLVKGFELYPSNYAPEHSGVHGGAIIVKLRDPRDEGVRAVVDASFLHAGALLEGPVGTDQSFYLAGRISYLDLLLKGQLEEEEDGVEIVQFPRYSDYQAKYLWRNTTIGDIRLQMLGADDEIKLNIAPDAEDILHEPDLAGQHFSQERYDSQALVIESQLSEGSRARTALAHSRSVDRAKAGNAGDVDNTVDRYLFKSHWYHRINSSHELGFGGEFNQFQVDFDLQYQDPGCTEFEVDCFISDAEKVRSQQHFSADQMHLFIKDKWFVGERWTVYPALVWHGENYLDQYHLEPRLSVEFADDSGWVLSGGYGIYHQMPEFLQIDSQFGNPELDYIRSQHLMLGLQKQFADGWSWKAEIYHKWLANMVSASEVSRYDNRGEGVAYGFESMLRKQLSDRWSGWWSLSLAKAERRHKETGDSFAFDYDQPLNSSLVTQYKMSQAWTFGAKLWLHSGAPYTPVIGAQENEEEAGRFDPIYGEINSRRLPFYNRLDLRLQRSFAKSSGRKWSYYLEILNALDSKNLVEYDYSRDYSERKEVRQLPRLISLGFKAEF